MPRDLGKAKRDDLTGHFPGESAEHVSGFATFLEGSGQLQRADAGSFEDGNGDNGRHGSTDTEVAPYPGGNGRRPVPAAQDTVFDEQPFAEMTPEPMEPMDAGFMEPEPLLSPEPLAPAAQPMSLDAEPADLQSMDLSPVQELDSVPDLTSPELDTIDSAEEEDETDYATAKQRKSLPTVRPRTDELPGGKRPYDPAQRDTGMLEMQAERLPEHDRLSVNDLRSDADSGNDSSEEETGLVVREGRDTEDEKITSKVDPRIDLDPRNPQSVVRDTVNFYNQTQSLNNTRGPQGSQRQPFPTISPNAVNSGRPLDLEPSLEPDLAPEPMEPAALDAVDDIDEADRQDTDKFREEDRRPPRLPQPTGSEAATRIVAGRGNEPPQLDAVAPERQAAGKDTQKFYVADILSKSEPAQAKSGDTSGELQPADSGPPPGKQLGTSDTAADYSTRSRAERKRAERTDTGQRPEPLPEPERVHTDFKQRAEYASSERLVPELFTPDSAEPDASFFDSEIAASLDSDDLDAEDEHTDREPLPQTKDRITERVLKKPASEPAAPVIAASEENRERNFYPDEPEISVADFDDLAAAEPPPPRGGTTLRPSLPEHVSAQRPSDRRQPVAASASARKAPESGRRITDALARRVREEREETMRLIQQAEEVAARLRTASEQSRTDLEAVSARRAAASADTAFEEPVPGTDVHDTDEFATIPPTPAVAPQTESTTDPESTSTRRSARKRVPTRAIGDLVDRIEHKLGGTPASLEDIIREASQRLDGVEPPAAQPAVDADVDELVAASSALREAVEAEWEEDRLSGTHAAVPAAAVSGRLSGDLESIWEEVDSRGPTGEIEGHMAGIAASEEIGIGWTQEALWKTLVGISGVTFALGALFVYVLYTIFSR
ncbi:MAG: hypothetical protein IPK87_10380 [Planctomycetes bacterium]|nr:hypothetical protein [Planctomycetota bacterium]